jgi:hypothetical protein
MDVNGTFRQVRHAPTMSAIGYERTTSLGARQLWAVDEASAAAPLLTIHSNPSSSYLRMRSLFTVPFFRATCTRVKIGRKLTKLARSRRAQPLCRQRHAVPAACRPAGRAARRRSSAALSRCNGLNEPSNETALANVPIWRATARHRGRHRTYPYQPRGRLTHFLEHSPILRLPPCSSCACCSACSLFISRTKFSKISRPFEPILSSNLSGISSGVLGRSNSLGLPSSMRMTLANATAPAK